EETHTMLLYLDNCCFNRPFDDQQQPRIHRETHHYPRSHAPRGNAVQEALPRVLTRAAERRTLHSHAEHGNESKTQHLAYNQSSQPSHIDRSTKSMKTDTMIMQQAMNALHTSLDPVGVERFIALLSREKFDYTQWHENLWTDETIDSLSQKAQAYYEQRHPEKNAAASS
ncbi:MAG: hypothetical protein AAGJ35_15530, partial [Myxococcota bacterium]